MDQPIPVISPAPPKKSFPKWPLVLLLGMILGAAAVFAWQKYLPKKTVFVGPSPLTLPQPSAEADPTAGWKKYTNSQFGFSFLYPKNVFVYDAINQPGDRLLIQNYQDVPGRQVSPNDFQAVIFINNNEAKDLADYPAQWVKELGQFSVSEFLLDGQQAIKGMSGQKHEAIPTVWVNFDKYVYIFQLSTPESTNAGLFDQILSTFKFTDLNSGLTNWKTYTAPEVVEFFSPFTLHYPEDWKIDITERNEEPKSLEVILTKNEEKIKIIQGPGGGGRCLYPDDADFNSYEGAGQKMGNYQQINQLVKWRLSQGQPADNFNYTVCELGQTNYLDFTRIGWIWIKNSSSQLTEEIISILEKIEIIPTPNTKTIFD